MTMSKQETVKRGIYSDEIYISGLYIKVCERWHRCVKKQKSLIKLDEDKNLAGALQKVILERTGFGLPVNM